VAIKTKFENRKKIKLKDHQFFKDLKFLMNHKLNEVKTLLEQKGYTFLTCEVSLLPDNYIDLETKKLEQFQKMLDALNDLDDVQEVYHNVNNCEE